jgi:transposase-like protein
MRKADSAKKKRSQRDYNMGFKLAVVQDIEKGILTYKQAQKKYGIQGRSTVLVWLRKHGNLDWNKPGLLLMSKSKETPAQKIKRLEKELSDERAKNTVLNSMIDLSDQYNGTSIRKKYLSQQSSEQDNTKE